jgi:ABC-type tungstate transport system substrate-binding protein
MDKGLYKPFKQYLRDESLAGRFKIQMVINLLNNIQLTTILNTWQCIGIHQIEKIMHVLLSMPGWMVGFHIFFFNSYIVW